MWSIVLVCTAEPDAELPVISYPVFGIAAALLAYSVYSIVIFAPGIKSRTKTLIRKNSLFTKLTEQYGFKTVFFSVISLVMTVAFAVMNGVSAIRYKSVWYASLTVLMIAIFSETAEHASRLLFLKAGVGFAACAAIIALAAVMIITANKRITLLKEKANDVGDR